MRGVEGENAKGEERWGYTGRRLLGIEGDVRVTFIFTKLLYFMLSIF